jgi:hypothetical protein
MIFEGFCGWFEHPHKRKYPPHSYGIKRIEDVNLKSNLDKCMFIVKNMRIFGHVIDKTRMKPYPTLQEITTFQKVQLD